VCRSGCAAAARRARARDHHLFRAALDAKELRFLERTAIKAAKQPLGDFRDPSDIERWADSIAALVTERS
jgi:hypothetical protein